MRAVDSWLPVQWGFCYIRLSCFADKTTTAVMSRCVCLVAAAPPTHPGCGNPTDGQTSCYSFPAFSHPSVWPWAPVCLLCKTRPLQNLTEASWAAECEHKLPQFSGGAYCPPFPSHLPSTPWNTVAAKLLEEPSGYWGLRCTGHYHWWPLSNGEMAEWQNWGWQCRMSVPHSCTFTIFPEGKSVKYAMGPLALSWVPTRSKA